MAILRRPESWLSWFPWYRRQAREADLARELRDHLELEAEEQRAAGLSPEEAARAAPRALGNTLRIEEDVRAAWGFMWLETLLQDLRFALRILLKSPGFAVVALLTLALGIGANAAIFQLIDAVRLRSLPVRNPETLAAVQTNMKGTGWGTGRFEGEYPDFTFPLWQQIRQRQQAFSSLAVWSADRLNLATGGVEDNANVIWVSGEFFQTLGLRPVLGRLISDTDDRPGCAGAVVLSYGFWQRRYGGAANVIGKTLTIEDHPFPILGVTPPGFYGVSVGDRFDVAVPVCAETIVNGQDSRINGPYALMTWWLAMLGRLKPGWNLKRATAQLHAITPAVLRATIAPQYDPNDVKHYLAITLAARPAANGFSNLRQAASTSLWLLLGLSGLVLLIACANLANLMLARGSARGREIALRLALGASRARVIRQFLLESALLAAVGTSCGALLAVAVRRSLAGFLGAPSLKMAMDWRVLAFAGSLAALTTVLFGLVPALKAGDVAPGTALKTAGRAMTAGRERFRLRRILVVTQVALALVLLSGALLFARSLRNLLTRDLGFQENGILVTNVDYTRLNLPVASRNAFETNLLDRIRAIPGVAAAADAARAPASPDTEWGEVLGGRSDEHEGQTDMDWVSPGYFRTMEIALLAGRGFDASDTAASPKAAVVDQAFAKKFLNPDKDAIGQRFRLAMPPEVPEPYYTVVGLARNSAYSSLREPFGPIAYLARSQAETSTWASILIRSRTGMAGLLNSVKNVIVGVNPEIDIEFQVLRSQIRLSLAQDELLVILSGFFGALALLLAALGLYGVISYTVTQRTNEIGVRMALGAQRVSVIRLVLGEVSVLIAIGIAVGTPLTLTAGRAAGSQLFELKPSDPPTLALAIVILAGIGFAASFVPARRASRLDPMTALRNE